MVVADGLQVLQKLGKEEPQSLAAVVIDAGSGEASQAMSCPPPAFLGESTLKDVQTALQPSGIMAVNCVTRSEGSFHSAIAAVQVWQTSSPSSIRLNVNPLQGLAITEVLKAQQLLACHAFAWASHRVAFPKAVEGSLYLLESTTSERK